MSAALRPWRALAAARSAAAALEFAIVCIPFLGLLIGLFVLGLDLYLQFALDYSLQQAVRQVQLGLVPAGTTAANFVGNVFCPIFVAFAPCTNVQVSVQPVADFYTASAITAVAQPSAFCVGAPGQLMYARAQYQAPAFNQIYTIANTVLAVPMTNGQSIVSAAAFANENPSGAVATGSAGC